MNASDRGCGVSEDAPGVPGIPARWTSIRMPVGQLHHARVGVTAKTVANHRANVAAALRGFGKEHHVSPRGVALSHRALIARRRCSSS